MQSNITKTLIYFLLLTFIFSSCSSKDDKDWNDYVREMEKDKTERLDELNRQLQDTLTAAEIVNLKNEYIGVIPLVENDFISSVKAFDRENSENRYRRFSAIIKAKKITYFDLYIELTECFKRARIEASIKAINSGMQERKYTDFVARISERYEVAFAYKYGMDNSLLLSFRNNYASCLGDNAGIYCDGIKSTLPNNEYW